MTAPDPAAARLLAEANLTGFALIRYMLECGSRASTEEVAERVLQYEGEAMAAYRGPGEYEVFVTPAQTLLFAQLASSAAAAFTAMCQLRAGREMSRAELLEALAGYEEMLLLGGSL